MTWVNVSGAVPSVKPANPVRDFLDGVDPSDLEEAAAAIPTTMAGPTVAETFLEALKGMVPDA